MILGTDVTEHTSYSGNSRNRQSRISEAREGVLDPGEKGEQSLDDTFVRL